MTDAAVPDEEVVSKPSKLPMILGLVLALLGGGGGFYATWSGMILGGGDHAEAPAEAEQAVPDMALPDVKFVSLPQLVVSLGPGSSKEHLIFRADLEVPTSRVSEVEGILPRVIDVLNSYLRALEPRDLEGASALIKLRGQMLRRIQLVTGEGRVRDLLVMEFVLN